MLFDDAHLWSGDELPERESAQFQQGKLDALLKLAPYAREGSREAAAVILKLDGSEYNFAEGEIDSVYSQIPRLDAVAHLHTHPYEWAQSEVDWSSFLLLGNVEQAHVITPLRTYSLHKPVGWQMLWGDSERRIEQYYLDELRRVTLLDLGWSPANERRWREATSFYMARRYNINFREGIRT